MKKWIIAIGTAVVCVAALAAALAIGNKDKFVDEVVVSDAIRVEGVITGVSEGYFLMQEQDLGEIQVNFSDVTVYEGVTAQEIAVGQYVFVDYDGKMTRSLPAQISAQKVSVYGVAGEVTELVEGGVVISREDGSGDVIVFLPQDAPALEAGMKIIAYTNGAMTMSLPPQTTALAVAVAAGVQ